MDRRIVCTSESDVKKEVKIILDLIGAFYFMPAAGAFGKSGTSDFIGTHCGKFFAIETKFGRNTPTPMQLRFGDAVLRHGGLFLIVNESNLGDTWRVKDLEES